MQTHSAAERRQRRSSLDAKSAAWVSIGDNTFAFVRGFESWESHVVAIDVWGLPEGDSRDTSPAASRGARVIHNLVRWGGSDRQLGEDCGFAGVLRAWSRLPLDERKQLRR